MIVIITGYSSFVAHYKAIDRSFPTLTKHHPLDSGFGQVYRIVV